jgi:hypothetical protein
MVERGSFKTMLDVLLGVAIGGQEGGKDQHDQQPGDNQQAKEAGRPADEFTR